MGVPELPAPDGLAREILVSMVEKYAQQSIMDDEANDEDSNRNNNNNINSNEATSISAAAAAATAAAASAAAAAAAEAAAAAPGGAMVGFPLQNLGDQSGPQPAMAGARLVDGAVMSACSCSCCLFVMW